MQTLPRASVVVATSAPSQADGEDEAAQAAAKVAARVAAVRTATRSLDPRTLGVTTGRSEPPRAVDLKRDLIQHLVACTRNTGALDVRLYV